MVILQHTSAIPEVEDGFHILRIEDIQPVSSPSFDDPTQMEDKLHIKLRVLTPGAKDVTFSVFTSPKLSEKSTLGGIVRAVFGGPPPLGAFDTALLHGQIFRHMINHAPSGWPRLVPGTSASAGEQPF